jgi:pyruvate dehydrogenase E2 component (dihydrolipoamide acetyltransferase)
LADVTLPSLGESVTEGIVTKWFKAVGDHVERDEPLYEISTDKVDSEMPSPATGILSEIVANEGDTVEVGGRLGVIGDADAATSPPPPSSPTPVALDDADSNGTSSVKAAASSSPTAPATPQGEATVTSPVVRRILEDAGVDASTVLGSGPGGVVTRKDAEFAASAGPSGDVVVPISNVRRRMAEHMSASVMTSPHAFVAVEADASAIARLRALGGTTLDGVVVEPSTVVAVAVVRALGEFELLNSTLTDDGLVVHHGVNLGFVLGLDDGMLVPVIHAAAGLTLRALARRVADLGERTVTRQLSTDDLMDATFTIAGAPSEHVAFTVPILIQPQVAIVSVGAPVRRVVPASEGFEVAERVTLGCSFDHRVVDATYVARFLDRVAELLAGLDVDSER